MAKISLPDLNAAADDLQTLPYFPLDSRASVINFLAKICPSREALIWLTGEAINNLRTWPGLAELRGLLCTRFDAADGIDAWCFLPGYSPAEMESRHIAKQDEYRAADKGDHLKNCLTELLVGSTLPATHNVLQIDDGRARRTPSSPIVEQDDRPLKTRPRVQLPKEPCPLNRCNGLGEMFVNGLPAVCGCAAGRNISTELKELILAMGGAA